MSRLRTVQSLESLPECPRSVSAHAPAGPTHKDREEIGSYWASTGAPCAHANAEVPSSHSIHILSHSFFCGQEIGARVAVLSQKMKRKENAVHAGGNRLTVSLCLDCQAPRCYADSCASVTPHFLELSGRRKFLFFCLLGESSGTILKKIEA